MNTENLKEELENIEIEESEMDEEDRLRKIEESMYWLHRKIKAIAEYIDSREEKTTSEEEELWDCGYSEGYEEGKNSVISDNRKEIEARKEESAKEGTSSEYSKGYADGVKNLARKMRDDIDKSLENKKELIEKLEEVLSIQMPPFADIATIMSQIQTAIAQQEQANKKETSGEPGEQRGEKEPDETKSTKNRVLGLGRRTGDV